MEELLDRPSWDLYFLRLAFEVSIRSDDQFIKHGSIIVDTETNHILSTGYNNTIPKANLDLVKPFDREARRDYMQHSEKNAILNCRIHPSLLKSGATIYVTGQPCINCLQDIISFGIKRIVFPIMDSVATITENKKTEEHRQNTIKMTNIKIDKIDMNNKWLLGYKK